MPIAVPICQGKVDIVFGGSHSPDEIVSRVKVFRGNWTVKGDTRGGETDGIREIEQRRSADHVCSFARQDAQRLWKEHVIACCQADATAGSVKSWQVKIARTRPQAVFCCQMELTIGTIDAFGIGEQDSVVVGWNWFLYALGYPKHQADLQLFGQFYQRVGFCTRHFNCAILKMSNDSTIILIRAG